MSKILKFPTGEDITYIYHIGSLNLNDSISDDTEYLPKSWFLKPSYEISDQDGKHLITTFIQVTKVNKKTLNCIIYTYQKIEIHPVSDLLTTLGQFQISDFTEFLKEEGYYSVDTEDIKKLFNNWYKIEE